LYVSKRTCVSSLSYRLSSVNWMYTQ
jgi:hypothetical protein